ncbi:UNVERIFIED_CONTAM: hypothetical protein FKN15_010744 [Acipenser sinensis]
MESKQKLQQQPLEDPASLFPWCSWCGEQDHRWRACPDGLPDDWCGRCEEYRHNWDGCPYAPAQASAACPLLSEEPAACPLLSEEPAACPLLSEEPAACPLLSEEPAACPLLSEEPATKKGGEVKEVPPPQPRPPPLQASPALPWEVPCPSSVDTGPECADLPPLDLAPRLQDSQAQSPAWSLAPLPLDFQMSLRRRKTSLRNGQTSLMLPLLVASFPLPTALLPLESQTSLRWSTATRLCLPVRAPGHQPALWSP